MMKQVGSRKKMILYLRGNRGGYLETEMYTASWFFDHDIKLGTEKERNKTKDRIIKVRGWVVQGELVVLIDSESTSASEGLQWVMAARKARTRDGRYQHGGSHDLVPSSAERPTCAS